jgi:acyl-CoA reductase-like NAD-dependent aldehyde dehydrogenase
MKTYKIYIDGKFPRTESGRYYPLEGADGKTLANICLSSRKDFREAVVAARKAQPSWASRSAYNRGQILYRIAEMLEGRRDQFVHELSMTGSTKAQAEKEVDLSVDRLVYYAGWCDKYQQVFSSVNPVESSHFNFSVPEPMGVISIMSAENSGLLGLITFIAPAISGGNTVVVLASSSKPLSSVTFGEVLNSSDVPAGVVNLLTGKRSELLTHFSTHMDVNAVIYSGNDREEIKTIKESASLNVKRVSVYSDKNLGDDSSQNPYRIMDLQEIKTTWHPIGQ